MLLVQGHVLTKMFFVRWAPETAATFVSTVPSWLVLLDESDFLYFLRWQVKEGSNAPRNTTFGLCMQKLLRVKVFFYGRCFTLPNDYY